MNRTFFAHLGENAVGSGCAAGASMLTLEATHLPDIAWSHVVYAVGIGALLSVFKGIASLGKPNGTASFLSTVVAAPKAGGWNPVDPIDD